MDRTISVIIPTLNEEAFIGACLDSLRAEGDFEVIVADGGSLDGTPTIVREYGGVRLLEGEKGRGPQMNLGASSAAGEFFLFLHADTLLEEGWSKDVTGLLRDDGVTGGAFTFAIRGSGLKYRIIEKWVKWRCRLLELPYGDQGFFVRRRDFEGIGGFSDIPLMEDVDIVERMKRRGRIGILAKRAFTHPRKWQKDGWLRRSLRNQVLMFLYRSGADPKKLFEMYYS
jgi:rSAM/selenodomain-associated transferase 2